MNPLNQWLQGRGAGVLLHPTSLPGAYGIGNLGQSSRDWVDFLAESNLSYWQICPLGPTGYGDSPYQCYSAFAGNLYLLDWSVLTELGLCTSDDLIDFLSLPSGHCDFTKLLDLYHDLREVIESNWAGFSPEAAYQGFYDENEKWLKPYVYFRGLKKMHGEQSWIDWPAKHRNFEKLDWGKLPESVVLSAEVEGYLQFKFFEQWYSLKDYANERGVQIVGDIPIYVSYDSADVWSQRELFQLNKKGEKKTQAGVPPDYFSVTGQLWGNPLYNWEKLKDLKFQWWMDRFEQNFAMYDLVRIDHFRAFESYWSVPASHDTAEKGKWVPGPGIDFFIELTKQFPAGKVIAEDLGVITPEVRALCDETGYPGMAVLHFGFGHEMDSEHLLHNVGQNTVLYAGTHDNDTTVGWYRSLPDFEQDLVRKYLGVSGEEIGWDLIRGMFRSHAELIVVTTQDLLSLGGEARFNYPGQALGNWDWRMTSQQLVDLRANSSSYIRELAYLFGRTRGGH